jgi:16S rRNA processing protein RimM
MNLQDCYKVGYVSKTHGLKGEVTINTLPECPDLTSIETIFLEDNGTLVPYFIGSISVKGDKAFVKFEDVDSIDAASELKGMSLYLAKAERPKLARGDFYNDEVIGFDVLESENVIGRVVGIMEAGPSRFLEVDNVGKEILIPINGPFIKSINKSKKKITVELPEGFLDL